MAYSRRSRYYLSPSPYKRYSRSISRSPSRSRSRDSSDAENPGNNLYVTGLSTRVSRRDLEKHFSTEGKDVRLVVDPWAQESRGFGFVTMSTVKDADRCVKYLDRSVLQSRVITVEKARRRKGRTPTPGRYLGLRTVRAHRGSPTYSRSVSLCYSSERERGSSRSYSPCYNRRHQYYSPSNRRRSYSPYHRRGRSYSLSRSPSYSRSPVKRQDHSYSPTYHRCYSPDERYYRRRSCSPYHRRGRSYSPTYHRGYHLMSATTDVGHVLLITGVEGLIPDLVLHPTAGLLLEGEIVPTLLPVTGIIHLMSSTTEGITVLHRIHLMITNTGEVSHCLVLEAFHQCTGDMKEDTHAASHLGAVRLQSNIEGATVEVFPMVTAALPEDILGVLVPIQPLNLGKSLSFLVFCYRHLMASVKKLLCKP